jgi:hypothetical protein
MDIKALQFESRFSTPPNSLGYCGRGTAQAKFRTCIIDGKCEGVAEEATKFVVLHPYLKTISEITKQPKFSYKVIEAFWLGNNLLKKAKLADYDLLLNNFESQGVPKFFVDKLRENKPKVFIPSHLFQVLHVGVGRASGAVPFNMNSINNCMVRWGKVEKIDNNTARTRLNSLKKNCLYKLVRKTVNIPFEKDIVPNIKTGSVVAVHWNMVTKVLTKKEEKKLEYWTKEVLRLI